MKPITTKCVARSFYGLIGLGIVELVLKSFFPIYLTGNIDAYQFDEVLGVRLKDNVHFLETTDYQQEILTNRHGSINLQHAFTDYDEIIFALGDSYTQGTGLPFDGAYPFQLSMILNMQHGGYRKKFAVINLGLAAYGMTQSVLALQKYVQIYGKPGYILYVGSSNDYSDDILFDNGYRHKHLVDGNPHWGWLLRAMKWIGNDTEIGKRVKIIVGGMRKKSVFSDARQSSSSAGEKIPIAERQQTKLQNLISISSELGAKLIVSWSDLPQTPVSSYAWLQRWAGQNDLAFADWYPKVESMIGAIPRLSMDNPHSGGHYRFWVNNLIAQSFSEHIGHEKN